MTRAGAIIGSVAGSLLAIGVLCVAAERVSAQAAMAPGGVGPGMVSGTPADTGGGDSPSDTADDTEAPSGPPAAGALGSARALVDRLNHALEDALSGHAGGPGAEAPASGALALANRDAGPSRGPVVMELFTSQGCSSCPPADEMFAHFANRPDVIALALHVDYWDYLGWEDPFAQPAFTARQKAYAVAAHSRSIYTPQTIIEGAQSLIGADSAALEALVAQEKARPAQVVLNVAGGSGRYTIDLSAPSPLNQPAVVQIVRYAPHARVAILRGENAGMVVNYANVVTAWHVVADWDGQSAARMTARIEGDQPAVLIVQAIMNGKSGPLPGPILAAARLN